MEALSLRPFNHRKNVTRQAWRPCWIATGDTPGTVLRPGVKVRQVTDDLNFRMTAM